MPALRAVVRYGYAPFMMLGLTGVALLDRDRAGRRAEQPLGLPAGWRRCWRWPTRPPSPPSASRPSSTSGTTTTRTATRRPTSCTSSSTRCRASTACCSSRSSSGCFRSRASGRPQWPLWAQLLMAFVISDFAFMMMHYLSHRYAPLWRLHAVHHGVGRLYGLNGVMRHPLHQVIDMIIGSAPLVIMGMPIPVAVLLGFVISVTLIVQHSNVDARLGPLQKHLSIGRIHHLHHVNWGTEGDCNFGLFLTIWDRLLGTFQESHRARSPPPTWASTRCRTSPRATSSSSCCPLPLQARRRRSPSAIASRRRAAALCRDAGAGSRAASSTPRSSGETLDDAASRLRRCFSTADVTRACAQSARERDWSDQAWRRG